MTVSMELESLNLLVRINDFPSQDQLRKDGMEIFSMFFWSFVYSQT